MSTPVAEVWILCVDTPNMGWFVAGVYNSPDSHEARLIVANAVKAGHVWTLERHAVSV